MTIQLPAYIKEHLYLELQLPVRCRPVSQADAPACSEQRNLATFHLMEVLEEQISAPVEHHDKRHDELRRLEHKMDLMLALLGQLLEQQTKPPHPHAVVLGLHGLCWQEDLNYKPDSAVTLELFLNKHTNPLCFKGRYQTLLSAENAVWSCVKFDLMSQQQQEYLEKWIFRCHRREVATTRHRQ